MIIFKRAPNRKSRRIFSRGCAVSRFTRVWGFAASACVTLEQVLQRDARALIVIQKFQTQFPGGKVPAGVKLPPPPSELTELQQERDQIILAAKNQLAADLGNASFDKVAKFAERRIAFRPQTGSSGS